MAPDGAVRPTVLHVNEAAFTAHRLIAEGRRRGYAWRHLPRAAPDQEWRGLTARGRRALVGAGWVARLRVLARHHDIVHVHSASTLSHSRWGAPRFVLHCHGSDVRTAQYDPARTRSIRAGLAAAEAVFYATPDLAEHVLPHRRDAIYLPVPVDTDNIPRWSPAPGQPRVVFASRWSPDKNSAALLSLARELVGGLDGSAHVVGLDWGPQAGDAAALGVQLVARGDHGSYLDLLAGADVVVGQATGMLGASELEALAAGCPLVVPVPLPLYAAAPPPVLGGTLAGAVAAVTALLDRTRSHDPVTVRRWVRDEHGVERVTDTVVEVYRDVMARR